MLTALLALLIDDWQLPFMHSIVWHSDPSHEVVVFLVLTDSAFASWAFSTKAIEIEATAINANPKIAILNFILRRGSGSYYISLEIIIAIPISK